MFRILLLLIRISLLALSLVGTLASVLLAYAYRHDYQPEDTEPIIPNVHNDTVKTKIPQRAKLQFLSWNIGYGGLGKESDLFYEGGSTIIPEQAWVGKNLAGIGNLMKGLPACDFFLLQEVDIYAHRSHNINQIAFFNQFLYHYVATFTPNFKVKYIPYPFMQHYGHVKSGISTYSKYLPNRSLRKRLQGEYTWPMSMFFVKRCLLIQYFTIENSQQQLMLINTHKAAYDTLGNITQTQMELMRSLAIEAYNQGHYVVVGGDWNQAPPNFNKKQFNASINTQTLVPHQTIANDFMPEGWQWVYDAQTPSNRSIARPYQAGKTATTILDFYLISPNIIVESVKTINTHFDYSDHQPVFMEIRLN